MTIENLKEKIAEYPDFPIDGVLFRDLSPLFKESMSELTDEMSKLLGDATLKNCDFIAGIESRGFILASALAQKFNKGLVLIRKPGKLPGEVVSQSYTLEYGSGELQMHKGSGKLIIVDDVLATGGTLSASNTLSERAGFDVVDVAVCINLKDLNSYTFKDKPIKTLFTY